MTVRDRLDEYREKADILDMCHTPNNAMNLHTESGAVAIAIEDETSSSDNLDWFLSQVAGLNKRVNSLKRDVDDVKLIHGQILSTPGVDERKKLELDDLMGRIKTNSQIIRRKIKENENSASSSASLRSRNMQHSALRGNFIDVMMQYQASQAEYRDRCKERLKRQLEISGSNFSDDDVEEMMERGEWSVLTRGLLLETEQAREMLANVEDRHKDILQLEESLRELHDLFVEMTLLVESQDIMVNSISQSVAATKNAVDDGAKDLRIAKEWKGRARKLKIFIGAIIALIFVVIIVTVVVQCLRLS